MIPKRALSAGIRKPFFSLILKDICTDLIVYLHDALQLLRTLHRMLLQVFTESDLPNLQALNLAQRYWDNVEHQRTFLDKVTKLFDIKSLDDWYKVGTKVQNS